MSEDNGWAAYLDEFRSEATEHLRALATQLLRLERDPGDPSAVREMFLSAHTIKGGAAMLEIADVRELAHALEDVLGVLRDDLSQFDSQLADLLFRTLDAMRELLDGATPGGPGLAEGDAALAAELRRRAAAGAEPPPEPAAGQPATATARPRVLLVEDSATVRMLESMLLVEAGFEVDALADGREALARATAQPYSLLVTGVETRGLRGLELAGALRRHPAAQRLPIVVMSSDDNAEHRRLAAEVGVQAYIRKGSLGQRRLVETVRELVPVPMDGPRA
jgi:chemotaxis protein histidine kinase CheA